MEFNFDNLDPTEFEEFCYDLLLTLEPAQLDWRKGTPLGSSPSDQGRDLEAIFHKTDIDGSKFNEKWNIECKHYDKGVPPEKLQGALAWATSTRPNVLLIIASGYLSNACKNHLSQYVENNKPPFRIVVWERKKLESLTSGNMSLRSKYGLTKDLPYLKLINNYHADYSLQLNYNTLNFFLEAMDELDDELREEVFYEVFFETIQPRFREPRDAKESLHDCMIDAVDYYSYKQAILNTIPLPRNYVVSTVSQALAAFFTGCDISRIKNLNSQWDAFIQTAGIAGQAFQPEFTKELRDHIEEQMNQKYERYNQFCDSFVRKLLSETRAI